MIKTIVFYLAFGLVITCSIAALVNNRTLYVPNDQLIIVQSLNARNFESITLALEPYRGIMLATNFLGGVDLYSLEDSYYPKTKYQPGRITPQTPLLTFEDSHYKSDAEDFVQLTDNLILIFKMRESFGNGRINIASVLDAYDRETAGQDWWHWVEKKATFSLQPQYVLKECRKTTIQFEYATRGNRALTMRVTVRGGASREFELPGTDSSLNLIEFVVDLPPKDLSELSIDTDSLATPLSENDRRKAAWIIRNLRIAPVGC